MVMGDVDTSVDLLVIGAGPGGYAAAFRAADLGLDVALVDPRSAPGGVCLHEGCIPSKSLLHLAELLEESRHAESMGVRFGAPQIDLTGVRGWKQRAIDTMAKGLATLVDKRGVQYLTGQARFENSTTARLLDSEVSRVTFRHAVIATGSRPIAFPGTDFSPHGRIMDAAAALDLDFTDIPGDLLVVGGGSIGLELGTVYAALGSRVHLVELRESLLAGVDVELVKPLERRLNRLFTRISLGARLGSLEENQHGVRARLETDQGVESLEFDRALIAMGRSPATDNLDLQHTRVQTGKNGSIQVDEQQRTADPHILAIGDVTGGPMLAHVATRQGRVAAEVIAGLPSAFDVRAVPAIVYTDPQIGWCGLTEADAKASDIAYTALKFPWQYSGRAQTMNGAQGLTKILADPESGRILGVGVVGRQAEGVLMEGVLAIEMGALAEDLALCLHPHPTLSETMGEAAELFMGSPTHILPPKGKQTSR